MSTWWSGTFSQPNIGLHRHFLLTSPCHWAAPHKSLGESQLAWLAWGPDPWCCCYYCCCQGWRWWLQLQIFYLTYTFSWQSAINLQDVWTQKREVVIVGGVLFLGESCCNSCILFRAAFLSAIPHVSHLHPQYPRKRLACVQLCIRRILTLCLPLTLRWFVFSLCGVKRSAEDLHRGFSGNHLACLHVSFNDRTSRASKVRSPLQRALHTHARRQMLMATVYD